MRNYKIVLMPLKEEDGGGWMAMVPALPGCVSDGGHAAEALAWVEDAIEDWIEVQQELGRTVPEEQFAATGGMVLE